jgi:beclin 1
LIETLQGKNLEDQPSETTDSQTAHEDDAEIDSLMARIYSAQSIKHAARQRRLELLKQLDTRHRTLESLKHKYTALIAEHDDLKDHLKSVATETARVSNQLSKISTYNSINDAFHIWYVGPYATINNLRLGTLPSGPVEWTEINAALGQAVLAIAMVIEKTGISTGKYSLAPLGSFSKIVKTDEDHKTRSTHSLYSDGSFSLFPKRSFNTAMVGFLHVVSEVGASVAKRDPTMAIPNPIDAPGGKVGGLSVLLGGDDAIWTRGLKFLCIDIKWILAWAAKHGYS